MTLTSPSLGETPPPPDSWPGAHGLRSVAPEVPSWPGQSTGSKDPGGSWPGMAPSKKPPVVAVTALEEANQSGGVAAIIFPALTVLILIGLIALWGVLDADHRMEQAVAIGTVVVVALGALIVSAIRHANR